MLVLGGGAQYQMASVSVRASGTPKLTAWGLDKEWHDGQQVQLGVMVELAVL